MIALTLSTSVNCKWQQFELVYGPRHSPQSLFDYIMKLYRSERKTLWPRIWERKKRKSRGRLKNFPDTRDPSHLLTGEQNLLEFARGIYFPFPPSLQGWGRIHVILPNLQWGVMDNPREGGNIVLSFIQYTSTKCFIITFPHSLAFSTFWKISTNNFNLQKLFFCFDYWEHASAFIHFPLPYPFLYV